MKNLVLVSAMNVTAPWQVKTLVFTVLVLGTNALWGQTTPALRTGELPLVPKLEIRRTAAKIQIDGRLNDNAWKAAEPAVFQFPWPAQEGAKQKTTARLLWDEQNLYVAYDCEDSDITARFLDRDDPTYRDDAVELFLNPRPGQSDGYFGFEMNARGVMYDYIYFLGRYLFKRLDLKGLQLATDIRGSLNSSAGTDQGWTLELAIPFAELDGLAGQTPKAGEEWALNLNRWDGTEPKRRLSQWSDSGLVATSPHNAKRFGIAVFKP